MNNWKEFDTYMIYDEERKIAVEWTTYGDNGEYFLSQEYEYENDMFDYEGDKHILVNEEITSDNTYCKLNLLNLEESIISLLNVRWVKSPALQGVEHFV